MLIIFIFCFSSTVQHILASTFSQRCVIWDLRKNEPIIKLTDANPKVYISLSDFKFLFLESAF